jgi:hypothetical protein
LLLLLLLNRLGTLLAQQGTTAVEHGSKFASRLFLNEKASEPSPLRTRSTTTPAPTPSTTTNLPSILAAAAGAPRHVIRNILWWLQSGFVLFGVEVLCADQVGTSLFCYCLDVAWLYSPISAARF